MVKLKKEIDSLEELLDISPELVGIVKAAKKTPNKHVAYSMAKRQASDFVGWTSTRKETATSTAYHIFIDYLCDEIGL